MAITKTLVYGSDRKTGFFALYKYLLANTVPDYFDTVTLIEGDSGEFIVCTSDGHDFMQITDTGSEIKVLISTTYQKTKVFTLSAEAERIRYIYKCKGGITFCGGNDTSAATFYPLFTLTKCTQGTAAVVMSENLTATEISTDNCYAIGMNDDVIAGFNVYPNMSGSSTVLCAIPTSSTAQGGNFIEDVLYMPWAHSRKSGEVEIKDVRYFSTGLWLVKDE